MRVYDLLKKFLLNKLDLNEISIAFDFDGVICDSQYECFFIASNKFLRKILKEKKSMTPFFKKKFK